MKIILTSPGTAPFIQQVARAFYEAEMLALYFTKFADNPNNMLRNFLVASAKAAGKDLATLFTQKKNNRSSFGKGQDAIEAWQKFFTNQNAMTLDVFGKMLLPEKLKKTIPANIYFHGTIPQQVLFKQYLQADILVFPTLGDGFGMVITEALAHGLPVITTENAGAADFIEHGVNGFIVPIRDSEAIAEKLDWCATHRQELQAMRQAAVKSVEGWQWADFRQALVNTILGVLQR